MAKPRKLTKGLLRNHLTHSLGNGGAFNHLPKAGQGTSRAVAKWQLKGAQLDSKLPPVTPFPRQKGFRPLNRAEEDKLAKQIASKLPFDQLLRAVREEMIKNVEEFEVNGVPLVKKPPLERVYAMMNELKPYRILGEMFPQLRRKVAEETARVYREGLPKYVAARRAQILKKSFSEIDAMMPSFLRRMIKGGLAADDEISRREILLSNIPVTSEKQLRELIGASIVRLFAKRLVERIASRKVDAKEEMYAQTKMKLRKYTLIYLKGLPANSEIKILFERAIDARMRGEFGQGKIKEIKKYFINNELPAWVDKYQSPSIKGLDIIPITRKE